MKTWTETNAGNHRFKGESILKNNLTKFEIGLISQALNNYWLITQEEHTKLLTMLLAVVGKDEKISESSIHFLEEIAGRSQIHGN